MLLERNRSKSDFFVVSSENATGKMPFSPFVKYNAASTYLRTFKFQGEFGIMRSTNFAFSDNTFLSLSIAFW